MALGHRLLRVIYHILLARSTLTGNRISAHFQPEERTNFRNNGSHPGVRRFSDRVALKIHLYVLPTSRQGRLFRWKNFRVVHHLDTI